MLTAIRGLAVIGAVCALVLAGGCGGGGGDRAGCGARVHAADLVPAEQSVTVIGEDGIEPLRRRFADVDAGVKLEGVGLDPGVAVYAIALSEPKDDLDDTLGTAISDGAPISVDGHPGLVRRANGGTRIAAAFSRCDVVLVVGAADGPTRTVAGQLHEGAGAGRRPSRRPTAQRCPASARTDIGSILPSQYVTRPVPAATLAKFKAAFSEGLPPNRLAVSAVSVASPAVIVVVLQAHDVLANDETWLAGVGKRRTINGKPAAEARPNGVASVVVSDGCRAVTVFGDGLSLARVRAVARDVRL